MMLEDLDSIDWSKHTHAYGPASNIPPLIRALASHFSAIWKPALEDLRGCIMHQGDVYEVAVFVIPFFIALLEDDTIQCREELLKDLAYMGFRGERIEGDSPYDAFLTRLYDAVAQGTNTYIKLLEEDMPEVRIRALHTLDSLREEAETLQVISRLYARFLRETDPRMKAGFVIYLGSRIQSLPEGENLLHNILQTKEEHPLVKVLAAQMQFLHGKEPVPRENGPFLLDILSHPDTIEEIYRNLPWQCCDDLVSTISNMLLSFGPDIVDLAVPALLKRLTYLDQCHQLRTASHEKSADRELKAWSKLIKQDYAVPSIMSALFYFAFQGRRLRPNAVPFLLTRTQRIVLTAILTSDVANNFSDEIVKNLDEYGLPYLWKLPILLQLNQTKIEQH